MGLVSHGDAECSEVKIVCPFPLRDLRAKLQHRFLRKFRPFRYSVKIPLLFPFAVLFSPPSETFPSSGPLREMIFNKINMDIDFVKDKSHPTFNNPMQEPKRISKRWIDFLEDEDVAFIKRLVLFSGSLKDLATAYDVTYPTVRLRLDRVIAKIKVFDDNEIQDEFERHLRATYAEGKIDAGSFKRLLTEYQKTQKGRESSK